MYFVRKGVLHYRRAPFLFLYLHMLRILFPIFLLFVMSCQKDDTPSDKIPANNLFIKAADLSALPLVRESGTVVYNAQGMPEDMLTTLKKAGVNTIRLRLWHNPQGTDSSLAEVKALAGEIKSNGMKVCITVHYSDTWADPGKQQKPAAWQELAFDALKQAVYDYTYTICTQIQPDYIQIGNEINNGFLWPDGSWENPEQFKLLLQSGVSAVRDAGEGLVIIHYAGHEGATAFFDGLDGLDYDIAGLSYYPLWHGTNMSELAVNMSALAEAAGKPVLIAETAYPFTLGWNDWTNNIVGGESQLISGYPATPQGQYDFLNQVRLLGNMVSGYAGFCYWGGELISVNGPQSTNGSAFENQAFWDFENRALPVLGVYSLPTTGAE